MVVVPCQIERQGMTKSQVSIVMYKETSSCAMTVPSLRARTPISEELLTLLIDHVCHHRPRGSKPRGRRTKVEKQLVSLTESNTMDLAIAGSRLASKGQSGKHRLDAASSRRGKLLSKPERRWLPINHGALWRHT